MTSISRHAGLLSLAILLSSAAPAQAQWCFGWDCYQQPAAPVYQPRRRPVEHKPAPPRVVYRERIVPKIVYRDRDRSWRSMSQDDAREWIKGQAQSFCGKYPKDEVCSRSE